MNKSSSLRTEALAGITTFFTMAYIVIVNPSLLSSEGTGMPFQGVLTATVLLSFTMTLLMGLYAKLPYAVAPGMGVNAFFTFTVILNKKVPWPTALGAVFWAGVLFLLISLTPLRVKIAQAVPQNLRHAAAVGIGLFITFIGLKNAGLIKADPVTFVRLGHLDLTVLFSLLGLFVMIGLHSKKNPFAFLIGIFLITALALVFGKTSFPEHLFTAPDFNSVLFKLDIWGALRLSLAPVIVSILFTDLFDSISTFIGVSQASKLLDKNGDPKNLREGLIVDACATFFASLFGTSSGTAYIESTAGIEMGGRTGLTSVFTALCFLPCFFIAPLAGMVPAYATAPVLVLVGAFMFRAVEGLKLTRIEDAVPAFLTLVLIPLTFSITQGILWGFISHVILYWITRRQKELPLMLYAIAGVSIFLLAFEQF